jgi:hypothetical protein
MKNRMLWFAPLLLVLTIAALSQAADLPCDSGAPTTVTVRWKAPPGSVSGYRLYRGEASGIYASPVEIAPSVASADAILAAQVPGGRQSAVYYYAIAAYNDAGEGARSNEIVSTPIARVCPALPGRPELLEIRRLLERIGELLAP